MRKVGILKTVNVNIMGRYFPFLKGFVMIFNRFLKEKVRVTVRKNKKKCNLQTELESF